MIVLVTGIGDELQLPPVPFEHSLLASTETTSDEHKAGVHIFSGFSHVYVYRLQTAMRFQDSVLVAILAKMRTPGGAKLTDREWKALQATSVDGPQHAHKLANTEHFFQACYTWSVVSLAYAVRSFESAKASGRTLYATRAVDVVQNVSRGQAAAVAEALLSHTNMNDTGRLPHFGLYHVGMEVRLTQTLAAPHVVVDCIGVIRGFTFAPEDEGRGDLNGSFVVLRRLPEAIYVQLQDVEQKFLATEPNGLFVVRPYSNNRAWSLTVKLPASHGGGSEEVTVKVRRTQMPLVTVKASIPCAPRYDNGSWIDFPLAVSASVAKGHALAGKLCCSFTCTILGTFAICGFGSPSARNFRTRPSGHAASSISSAVCREGNIDPRLCRPVLDGVGLVMSSGFI